MEFNEQAYEALVATIFRRFPSVQKAGFDGAYKPGLSHMEAFDAALGSPSKAFRCVHVAGTNGKGSVSHLLASVLSAAGYRTGLYTSPHLIDFRERIKVLPPSFTVADGGMVPKEYAYTFLTEWMPYCEAHELSFFEITTGLCFKYFADCGVEVAVLETGLGGLLDSTNIVTPVLSLVTNIGMDHMAWLGNSLAEIAAQKAGIFKPGVPALVGESVPVTRPVFVETARRVGCPLSFAEEMEPTLWDRREEMLAKMDLQAAVQRNNLRTVLAALDILRGAGFRFDETETIDAIEHAARRTGFRGRWELLLENPRVICDIGHNAHALRSNFAQLEAAGGELFIVYGIMADKDLDAILPLMPPEATYIFTTPDTPRALPGGEILRRYRAFRAAEGRDAGPAYEAPTVRDAVEMALLMAREAEQPLVYIGGSTFVVAEAVTLF